MVICSINELDFLLNDEDLDELVESNIILICFTKYAEILIFRFLYNFIYECKTTTKKFILQVLFSIFLI